jgi:tetratricopeptide (TPR) repeat protein
MENYAEAIGFYNKSRNISLKIKDRQEEEKNLIQLVKAYCALGDYEKAIDYNHQHLDIVQAISQDI